MFNVGSPFPPTPEEAGSAGECQPFCLRVQSGQPGQREGVGKAFPISESCSLSQKQLCKIGIGHLRSLGGHRGGDCQSRSWAVLSLRSSTLALQSSRKKRELGPSLPAPRRANRMTLWQHGRVALAGQRCRDYQAKSEDEAVRTVAGPAGKAES